MRLGSKLQGAAMVCAALTVLSCSKSDTATGEEETVTVASGDDRVPSSKLTDWVSYGDAVVVVTIAEEHELEATPEEIARGEGYVPREVTASVDEIVWQHPGSPDVPETLRYLTAGWALREHEKYPMVFEGSPRVSVGERYLMAITRFTADGPLSPMGSHAVLPVSSSGETLMPASDTGGPQEVEVALGGLSASEIGKQLSSVVPDPVAEANRDLPAEARYHAVLESQGLSVD